MRKEYRAVCSTIMMNCCAGIVTYNPDIDRLKKNIDGIICQIPFLIICDNGSANFEDISEIAKDNEKIIVISNTENKGIAYALNRIFEYSVVNAHCEWVLTLDQDSVCPNDMISNYMKYCDDSIGIVCPLFRDPHVEYGTSRLENNVVSVEHCITSGSFTNTKAWEAVKGFDEIMFIDFVDFDFCYRLRKAGYEILQVQSVVINHTIGNCDQRSMFGKKIILSNHTNMRKYYIARNYIYYRKKNRIKDATQKKAMQNKILKTMLFEEDKLGSLHAFLLGWIDGNRLIHGRKPIGWKS